MPGPPLSRVEDVRRRPELSSAQIFAQKTYVHLGNRLKVEKDLKALFPTSRLFLFQFLGDHLQHQHQIVVIDLIDLTGDRTC